MKQKLAILIYSLAGGGAERVVSILLKPLMEHFDLTLVLMNDTVHYDLPDGLEIRHIEHSDPAEPGLVKLFKLPLLGWRYRELLRREKITISLSFMNRPNYISVIAKLFGSGARTIISERGNPSSQYAGGSLSARINRWLILTLYPRADLITTNSEGNRWDLINNFDIARTVIPIYNPIDLAQAKTLAAETVIMPDTGTVFITVGRLDAGKNHRMQIEAFGMLEDTDTKLLIIGDGPLRETLEDLIREKKLQKRVMLLGRQRNPFSYLVHADIFLFSSNQEGFPNVLLEALACGLGIISTDCPSGPREILAPLSDPTLHLQTSIEEAEFGILIPCNDTHALQEAMQRCLVNPDLLSTYRNHAKIRAENFAPSRSIDAYLRILTPNHQQEQHA